MMASSIASPKKLRRVFVWELPVRIYHWLNALAIVALIVTGYLIGNPPAFLSAAEASDRFFFGWIKFIHFAAAYIFFFNFIFRVYWSFVGNKYAHWRNFLPISKKFFKEMWSVIRIDILLKKDTEHLSVGHNALAAFFYFLTFLAFILQSITGFALYANMSDGWFAYFFKWIGWTFWHNEFAMRNWHHATMWFFIVFAMVHIYLVFYHDYVEGRGEISSMGGGWKFIEEEVFQEKQQKETETK